MQQVNKIAKKARKGSVLAKLKDEMHLKVKMQVLQNCIAELEKTVLQHGECFSSSKDDSLVGNEHAEKAEKLKDFMKRGKEQKAMLISIKGDLAKDRGSIEVLQ